SFFTPTADGRYRILPTSVEPVKPTNRTAGCSHSTLPIGGASPVMMLSTPLGMPAFSASTASASADSGECRRVFSRDHRVREVPRGDGAADADRLLDREQPRIGPLRRDGLAI